MWLTDGHGRFLWGMFIAILLSRSQLSNAQSSSSGNYYDDYHQDDYGQQQQQDSLYHDYAARQQTKEMGVQGAGAGWMKLFSAGAAGWLIGAKFHSGRIKKKLNAKHKEDQKKLYQQYYNDVYSLQQQNAELIAALEQYAASSRRM